MICLEFFEGAIAAGVIEKWDSSSPNTPFPPPGSLVLDPVS